MTGPGLFSILGNSPPSRQNVLKTTRRAMLLNRLATTEDAIAIRPKLFEGVGETLLGGADGDFCHLFALE